MWSSKKTFIDLNEHVFDTARADFSSHHQQWRLFFKPVLRLRKPMARFLGSAEDADSQFVDPRYACQAVRFVQAEGLLSLAAVLQGPSWNDNLQQILECKAGMGGELLQRRNRNASLDILPVEQERC